MLIALRIRDLNYQEREVKSSDLKTAVGLENGGVLSGTTCQLTVRRAREPDAIDLVTPLRPVETLVE